MGRTAASDLYVCVCIGYVMTYRICHGIYKYGITFLEGSISYEYDWNLKWQHNKDDSLVEHLHCKSYVYVTKSFLD